MFRKQEGLGESMRKRKGIACIDSFFRGNGKESRNVILPQYVASSVALCLDYSVRRKKRGVLTGGMADD